MQQDDEDRLDTEGACAFIGGNRPIHPSTLWRGVKTGRYSKPTHVGPQSVRWSKAQIRRDIARMNRDAETDDDECGGSNSNEAA